jgi:hypothetical protein
LRVVAGGDGRGGRGRVLHGREIAMVPECLGRYRLESQN